MPVTFVDGHAVVEARLGGRPLRVLVDTGARDASFVKEEVASDLKVPLVDGAFTTRRFAVGDVDLGPTKLVPIEFGGRLAADGMIGGPVFARHRVCFDAALHVVTID